MFDLNRRDLLKSAIAVPLSTALSPFAQAFSENKEVVAKANSINVVVHGLCALKVEKSSKYLDVVIPAVPGHTYGIGTWAAETMMEKGKHYNLTGCDNCPADPTYDPNYDAGISKVASEITSVVDAMRYCWLRVPIPSKIIALRAIKRQKGDPDFLTGQAVVLNNLHPLELPMVHALQYVPTVPLSLNGIPIPLGTNVHVWAEPAFDVQPAHISEAFGLLVEMLEGLDLDVNPSFEQKIAQYDVNANFTEVPSLERRSLYERYCAVAGTCKKEDLAAKAPSDAAVQFVTKIRNCIQIVIKP